MNALTHSRRARWLPFLILLMLLGGILRLVNLDAPPMDFQPTRQMRNSLVARAIYYHALPGADPETVALAESFRRAVGQYEPPITEWIVGHTFLLTGGETFAVPRILGMVVWLAAGLALFDLARRIASPSAALLALAYYLVLPFAVQASRSFQPDPMMTASFVGGVYFLYRWTEEQKWQWAILAAALAAFAILVKVVIVFLIAAVAVAAVLLALGRRFWRSAQVWAMFGVMTLPAFAYYVLGTPGRSTEYFFAWTVDLVRLIGSVHFYADWLGFVGSLFGLTIVFLSLLGTLLAPPRARWILVSLWLGYLVYGLTLPFQMVTHSYYHIQLVPLVALGLAPALDAVVVRAKDLGRPWQVALVVPVLAFLGYQSWAARSVLVQEDYSQVPAFWESVAAALPQNADVIALTQDYGFDLMYWGWRKVDLWPLATNLAAFRNSDRDLASRFSQLVDGDRYFLVTSGAQLENQPELRSILDGYEVAAQGPGYMLYDLQSPR
ncbi:MAG: ArnT family glycosyltransferase [Anaerolineales bacterium]